MGASGGSSDSSSSSSSDGGSDKVVFSYGNDRNDGSYRQDRYSNFDGSKHDHTWSKTDPVTGQHKEGFKGRDA